MRQPVQISLKSKKLLTISKATHFLCAKHCNRHDVCTPAFNTEKVSEVTTNINSTLQMDKLRIRKEK